MPKTSSGHDTTQVIVDRLTNFTHFLPTKDTNKIDKLTMTYLKEIVKFHEVSTSIIFYRDIRFTS